MKASPLYWVQLPRALCVPLGADVVVLMRGGRPDRHLVKSSPDSPLQGKLLGGGVGFELDRLPRVGAPLLARRSFSSPRITEYTSIVPHMDLNSMNHRLVLARLASAFSSLALAS